jgi:hypothetical protein
MRRATDRQPLSEVAADWRAIAEVVTLLEELIARRQAGVTVAARVSRLRQKIAAEIDILQTQFVRQRFRPRRMVA